MEEAERIRTLEELQSTKRELHSMLQKPLLNSRAVPNSLLQYNEALEQQCHPLKLASRMTADPTRGNSSKRITALAPNLIGNVRRHAVLYSLRQPTPPLLPPASLCHLRHKAVLGRLHPPTSRILTPVPLRHARCKAVLRNLLRWPWKQLSLGSPCC